MLAENHRKIDTLTQRIDTVSTHWFYGTTALQPQLWFRGGTQGKIERARAKLAAAQARTPQLDLQRDAALAARPQLAADVEACAAASARLAQVVARQTQIKEAVVAAHSTPALLGLQAQQATQAQAAQFEASNTALVQNVLQLCCAAHGHYRRAASLMQSARTMNQMAMRHNRIDHVHHRHGHHHGHHHHGHRRVERMDQNIRDMRMREAQAEADRGAVVLSNAFAAVPTAVRTRYPTQCAQLGSVAVPRFEQVNAGTRMLEFMGGAISLMGEFNSGDKIRSNLAVIRRCEEVCAQQEAIVRTLEAQMRRDGDAARALLAQTKVAVALEEDTIFAAQFSVAPVVAAAVATSGPSVVVGTVVSTAGEAAPEPSVVMGTPVA